jgi:hypothetical protein
MEGRQEQAERGSIEYTESPPKTIIGLETAGVNTIAGK